MPMMPPGCCNVPRCPGRADVRGKCVTHAREAQRQHDATRGNSSQRGYGQSSGWPEARAGKLKAHPVCCVAGCGEPATVADHYPVSVREGRQRGWTWQQIHHPSNLRSMCKSHHDARTGRDQGWGRAR
jgi:5-methylcytosine-specific restriction enzyme A